MIYYILLQTSTEIISLKNTSTNRHIESANLIHIALVLSFDKTTVPSSFQIEEFTIADVISTTLHTVAENQYQPPSLMVFSFVQFNHLLKERI